MAKDREVFDFEYEEVEETDEEIEEIERPLIDNMELIHLRNCEISSKKGVPDQGFPQVMKRLMSLRFVETYGPGFRITNEGVLYLDKYRKKLNTI